MSTSLKALIISCLLIFLADTGSIQKSFAGNFLSNNSYSGLLTGNSYRPNPKYKKGKSKQKKKRTQKNVAPNSAKAVRQKNHIAAKKIAKGHAFEKHVLQRGEFSGFIRTRKEFSNHIENVMNNPTAIKELARDRTAYWHESSRTVVIHNPRAIDGGTAFQPPRGRAYFDGLRRN